MAKKTILWILVLSVMVSVLSVSCFASVPAEKGKVIPMEEPFDRSKLRVDDAITMLEALNARRVELGAEPLVMDKYLMAAAEYRAYELTAAFGHYRPNGEYCATCCSRIYSECCASVGPKTTAKEMAAKWETSETHWMLLTSKTMKSVGVAFYMLDNCLYVSVDMGNKEVPKADIVTRSSYKKQIASVTIKNGVVVIPETATPTPAPTPKPTPKPTPTPTPAPLPFKDVPSNAYYTDAIRWAIKAGVTNGTTATTFEPNKSCTRAQVVTFLWRSAGSPEPPSSVKNTFKDVKKSDYYYKAVLWAVNKGITNGTTSTSFSPSKTCTRAEAVTFLWRAVGSPKVTYKTGFKDVSASSYYAPSVAWAVSKGVATGTSPTAFSPNSQCTRAQIVTFLYRTYA